MKTFDYAYTVTMGDVSAMGNYYFLNYFEIQGHMRELWLKESVSSHLEIIQNYILSTKCAHCDFKIPFFLYEDILVRMYVTDLERVSVKFHFDYYKKTDDKLCASGYQLVVCKDPNRRTCRIPEALSNAFKAFLAE
jgi:acyl-CoA thioesterase FadM